MKIWKELAPSCKWSIPYYQKCTSKNCSGEIWHSRKRKVSAKSNILWTLPILNRTQFHIKLKKQKLADITYSISGKLAKEDIIPKCNSFLHMLGILFLQHPIVQTCGMKLCIHNVFAARGIPMSNIDKSSKSITNPNLRKLMILRAKLPSHKIHSISTRKHSCEKTRKISHPHKRN